MHLAVPEMGSCICITVKVKPKLGAVLKTGVYFVCRQCEYQSFFCKRGTDCKTVKNTIFHSMEATGGQRARTNPRKAGCMGQISCSAAYSLNNGNNFKE